MSVLESLIGEVRSVCAGLQDRRVGPKAAHGYAMADIGLAAFSLFWAQGLYSALAMGALLGLAMIVSGGLYEAVGGLAFLLGTGLCAGSVVAGLVLVRRWDGQALWT
ncbi:hypothetical protein [uncultured Rhodospira sp.]|uniref:hypothetical protein n=1 Tax=uncultured Rhodospira sp. TaxID=1936189 RepID=UPI002639B49F|nr:hypothetical protein [uncultured Rhodospira sp.]